MKHSILSIGLTIAFMAVSAVPASVVLCVASLDRRHAGRIGPEADLCST